MTREKVLINQAACNLCGEVIESKHVHDYRHCGCGEIMVDGGREYLRRGWNNPKNFIELSKTEQVLIPSCVCVEPKTYSRDGKGYCFTCLGYKE